jgi:hypothetical protein
MSGIKTFDFSVSTRNFAVGTVAKMNVVFSEPLCIADQEPCESFRFSVVIDNNKASQHIPMTTEEAQNLALQKAIKMLQDFAASRHTACETPDCSIQADQ